MASVSAAAKSAGGVGRGAPHLLARICRAAPGYPGTLQQQDPGTQAPEPLLLHSPAPPSVTVSRSASLRTKRIASTIDALCNKARFPLRARTSWSMP